MTTRVVSLTDDDKHRVIRLIREAHGDAIARSHETFWDWRIHGNPWGAAPDHHLGLEVDGDVAGAIALVPAQVKLGDDIFPALWPLDLVVSPAAKQHRVATGSLMLATTVARMPVPILYGGSPERVGKLWGRAFGVEAVIGRYRIYHRVFALAPVLRERRQLPRWLAAIAGLAYAAAGSLALGALALRSSRDLTVRRVERFDDSFDALWAWASPGYQNILLRDRHFLAWRFIGVPGRSYTTLGAYRGDRLVGYVVLRWTQGNSYRSARIVDIFTRREEKAIFRRLLWAALREARRAGAATVTMMEPGQEEFRRELRRALFFPGRDYFCVVGRSLVHPPSEFYDARKWWITLADGDLDTAT